MGNVIRMNEFYHEFGLFGHPDKPDELGIYAGHVRDLGIEMTA